MPQHSSSLSNERNRRLAGCQAVCTITKPIVGGEVIDRPKALGDIWGVTYIYGMFCRFGLINVP